MDEQSNIVRHRVNGANDIVLGDSHVGDLGIELSNIRKFKTRERSDVLSTSFLYFLFYFKFLPFHPTPHPIHSGITFYSLSHLG